jgi:hypothetical protein
MIKIVFLVSLCFGFAREFEVIEPKNQEVIWTDSVRFNGYAPPNAKVLIRGQEAIADSTGSWELEVAGPKNPGSYDIKVSVLHTDSIEKTVTILKLTSKISDYFAEPTKQKKMKETFQLLLVPYQSNDPSLISLDSKEHNFYWLMERQGMQVALLRELPTIEDTNLLNCFSEHCTQGIANYWKIPYSIEVQINKDGREYLVRYVLTDVEKGVEELSMEKKVSGLPHKLFKSIEEMNREFLLQIQAKLKQAPGKQAIPPEWTKITSKEVFGELTLDKSPYFLEQSIIVPSGKALTIQEGVKIYIGGTGVNLNIFGKLTINGSSKSPVKIMSSKKYPAGGDWERIIIKSAQGAEINHLSMEHSNYGINVINSKALIKNSLLRKNKYRGVLAANSDVLIEDSEVSMGHQVAVHADAYSNVTITRSRIHRNKIANVVMPYGSLILRNSLIEKNHKGLLLLDSVSLEVFNSKIRNNQVGLASNTNLFNLEGSKKGILGNMSSVEGIFHNDRNFLKIPKSIVEKLTEIPIKRITKVKVSSNRKNAFKGGFSQKDPADTLTFSHIGSISMGREYSKIKTARNSGPKADFLINDTVPKGGKYPNDKQYSGFTESMNIYFLSQYGEQSLEFSMDARHNDWHEFLAEPLSLRYSSPSTEINLGDVNISGSEYILSGFQLLGGQVKQKLFTKNYPKFKIQGGLGETQEILDINDLNRRTFADTIEDGEAKAQRVFGYGQLDVNWTENIDFGMGYSWLKDQRTDPWVRSDLTPGVKTMDPLVEARGVYSEGSYRQSKGKWEINMQMLWGEADTLASARQNAVTQILIAQNLSSIQGLEDELLREPSVRENSVKALLDSSATDLSAQQLIDLVSQEELKIESEYDSDRPMGLKASKDAILGKIDGVYKLKDASFQWYLSYTGKNSFSPGNTSILQNAREFSGDFSMKIMPSVNLDMGYFFVVENASGVVNGGNILGISRDLETGVNALSPKHRHNISLKPSYSPSEKIDFSLAYDAFLELQPKDRTLDNADAETYQVYRDGFFTGNDSVVLNDGSEVVLDSSKWNTFMALEDPLASGFEEKKWTHKLQLNSNYRFGNRHSLKLGTKLVWVRDHSDFSNRSSLNGYTLADTTFEKLGYYFNAMNYYQHSYPLTLNLKWKDWQNRSVVKYRNKKQVRADEQTEEWSLTNRLKWVVISRKFSLTLESKMRTKSVESQGFKFFAQDTSSKERYEFYSQVDNVVVPEKQETANNETFEENIQLPSNYTLVSVDVTGLREELDLSLSLLAKYNFTTRLYLESEVSVNDYQRPDALPEEYRNFAGKVNLYYSF